jgi:mannitol/fructose-specific phosphotransferase system IIA component
MNEEKIRAAHAAAANARHAASEAAAAEAAIGLAAESDEAAVLIAAKEAFIADPSEANRLAKDQAIAAIVAVRNVVRGDRPLRVTGNA